MTRTSIAGGSLVALGAALALAGCGSKTTPAANEAAADNGVAAVDNSTAAVPPEDVPLPAGDNAVAEDESTAPAIQVVTVPTPAPTAPAAETAPLTDAIAAEQAIDAGTGITRVQQADGWAWLQNGEIIRTASADGHRVAYFRRGATTPYFVQQDDRGYAYDNGKPTHQYDGHGRVAAPDAKSQAEARDLADAARRRHDSAQQASRTAPHVDRSHVEPPHGQQPQSPAPTPSPSVGHDDHHGSADKGRRSNSGDRTPDSGTSSHERTGTPGSRSDNTNHQPPHGDRHDSSNGPDDQGNQAARHR
jgi:hypothetical protein